MAYVNKMDITGADFYRVVDMMKERLGANAVPIQLPIGKENTFRGIIDLVRMRAEIYYDDLGQDVRDEDIPADMQEIANEYRANLIEKVAETDDALMEKYLGRRTDRGIDPDGNPQMHDCLHHEPRAVRYQLPQQGRSAAAGRGD